MTADEIKSLINSNDYYNRYDKDKHWDHIGVLVGRATQAAEINEIQSLLEEKIKRVSQTLYENVTIINGCGIYWNSSTVALKAGQIFIDGLVYDVEAKNLTLSNSTEIKIGVWKISNVVTYDEDASLRNPAKGYPEYRSPGACRIVTKIQWGLSTDSYADNAKFFEVYRIRSGAVTRMIRVKPDLVRYDRDAHGNYAVEGLTVTFVNSGSRRQNYKISKGLAHINGYETELMQEMSLSFLEVIEGENITQEVTQSEILSEGNKIQLTHIPVENVLIVRVTKQRTVSNLTHGIAGCVDQLPDESVTKILQVKQGAKFYIEGTDFNFVSASDGIDWSLSGDEPTPESKYDVTYEYRVNAAFSFNNSSVTVSDTDFVRTEPIDVTYAYRMPRMDIIVMNEDCSVEVVRGEANFNNPDDPITPNTPSGAICLAEIKQTWIYNPEVKNSVRNMREQINELYSLIHDLRRRLDGEV